jgi:hypothetical protein
MNPKSHTNRAAFALALAAASVLSGCQGALLGNLLVLGVTIGIFFGTLGLGRTSQVRSSATSPDRSQS